MARSVHRSDFSGRHRGTCLHRVSSHLWERASAASSTGSGEWRPLCCHPWELGMVSPMLPPGPWGRQCPFKMRKTVLRIQSSVSQSADTGMHWEAPTVKGPRRWNQRRGLEPWGTVTMPGHGTSEHAEGPRFTRLTSGSPLHCQTEKCPRPPTLPPRESQRRGGAPAPRTEQGLPGRPSPDSRETAAPVRTRATAAEGPG